MKNKTIVFALCFILVFASIAFVEAGLFNRNKEAKEKCDLSVLEAKIPTLLTEVNSDQKYLDFISQSGYDAVKLVAGDKTYYFIYENNEVKQAESVEDTDFTVKINCNRINKIIESYNNNDSKHIRMIINQIPGRVKIKLFKQCMATEWCKNEIL